MKKINVLIAAFKNWCQTEGLPDLYDHNVASHSTDIPPVKPVHMLFRSLNDVEKLQITIPQSIAARRFKRIAYRAIRQNCGSRLATNLVARA